MAIKRPLQWYDRLFLAFAILVMLITSLTRFAFSIGSGIVAIVIGMAGMWLLYRFLHKDLIFAEKALGNMGILGLTVLVQAGCSFVLHYLSR